MYHIAQNDPPALKFALPGSDVPLWSEAFRSFVDHCLRKDPAERFTTSDCLEVFHAFLFD